MEIMKAAQEYEGDIYLKCGDTTVNAKSIMLLMLLAAVRGSKVEVLFEPNKGQTTPIYDKICAIANKDCELS